MFGLAGIRVYLRRIVLRLGRLNDFEVFMTGKYA